MTVTKNVNLASYKSNLEIIAKEMHPARVMAVVKADAYGHGLVEIARAASESGVPILGVLDIETGIELRSAGISTPAFAWLHSESSDFETAVRLGIELSASSISELESIARVSGIGKVHLKLDTGLSRNGCRPENWQDLVSRAVELDIEDQIDLVAVWTHLSGTSRDEDQKSLDIFDLCVAQANYLGFTGYRHAASSPAAFGIPESRYELVRIGVSAFGTNPTGPGSAEKFGLTCPMTLRTEVISEGVIGVGFLHGYFSQLAAKAKVAIGGQLYRVLEVGPLATRIEAGRYEMGDEVILFGDHQQVAPTAEELCDLLDTVTDELFTGIKTESVTYTL